MKLLLVILCCMMLTGCASVYKGFTVIRIKAGEFKGNMGPLNSIEGKDIDMVLAREMTLTADENRDVFTTPDISMSADKGSTTFDIATEKVEATDEDG